MWQSWQRLLFLHWRCEPEVIQAHLPAGLTVDTHDGSAWLGIVPFFMRNIRIRGLPPLPTATNFLELNLRTYVFDAEGTPGVWFFSLDANSRLTVWGARAWFRLPYFTARMSAAVDPQTARVDYHSRRLGTPAEAASHFEYAPSGPLRVAEPGSLEFFLIERYILFTDLGRGRLATGRVRALPYQVAGADIAAWDKHLIALDGLPVPEGPPAHAVVAPGVDVEVFGLRSAPPRD